jgi:PII-like signaling protein
VPTSQVATRIVIFLSEDDRSGHHGLHEALLDRAREDGMAGATIWRGIEGFGSSGRMRTGRFPDAMIGLPVTVELIDSPERIEEFLPVIKELAPGSFVTREEVRITRFSPAQPSPALDDPAPRSPRRT